MKSLRSLPFLLPLLLLLTTACATRVDGLYVSEHFNPASLQRDFIVTGGVADTSAAPTAGQAPAYNRLQSNTYSALMLSAFKDERGELRIKPVETLIQSIGGAEYDRLIGQYARAGLTADDLALIAGKMGAVRYVALARIDSNTTEADATHQDKYETKDGDGKVTKHPATWTKTHKRTLVVSLHIYDLLQQGMAFSGQVTKYRQNTKTYTVDDVSKILSVVQVLRGKDLDSAYPMPEAPDTRQVLSEVFAGFAENFPEG